MNWVKSEDYFDDRYLYEYEGDYTKLPGIIEYIDLYEYKDQYEYIVIKYQLNIAMSSPIMNLYLYHSSPEMLDGYDNRKAIRGITEYKENHSYHTAVDILPTILSSIYNQLGLNLVVSEYNGQYNIEVDDYFFDENDNKDILVTMELEKV